jgi:hypothetical protein
MSINSNNNLLKKNLLLEFSKSELENFIQILEKVNSNY